MAKKEEDKKIQDLKKVEQLIRDEFANNDSKLVELLEAVQDNPNTGYTLSDGTIVSVQRIYDVLAPEEKEKKDTAKEKNIGTITIEEPPVNRVFFGVAGTPAQ